MVMTNSHIHQRGIGLFVFTQVAVPDVAGGVVRGGTTFLRAVIHSSSRQASDAEQR